MSKTIASDTLSSEQIIRLVKSEKVDDAILKQKREGERHAKKPTKNAVKVSKSGGNKSGGDKLHRLKNSIIITINNVQFEKSITRNGVKPYICAGCNAEISVGENSIVLLQIGNDYNNFDHRHTHLSDKCERLAGQNMARSF